MRLYDIANDYRVIDAAIDEAGGELSPEQEAQLDALDNNLAHKIDAISGLITEAEAYSDALGDQSARFRERAKVQYNKAQRLKKYVIRCLKSAGKRDVKGDLFTVRVGDASTPTIRWTADAPIPRMFTRVKEELDGAKVQAFLKEGGTLPDGFTVERSQFLVVR